MAADGWLALGVLLRGGRGRALGLWKAGLRFPPERSPLISPSAVDKEQDRP